MKNGNPSSLEWLAGPNLRRNQFRQRRMPRERRRRSHSRNRADPLPRFSVAGKAQDSTTEANRCNTASQRGRTLIACESSDGAIWLRTLKLHSYLVAVPWWIDGRAVAPAQAKSTVDFLRGVDHEEVTDGRLGKYHRARSCELACSDRRLGGQELGRWRRSSFFPPVRRAARFTSFDGGPAQDFVNQCSPIQDPRPLQR